MTFKYLASFLAFTLLLAACAGPLSIPTTVMPRIPPKPSPTPNAPTSYPQIAYPGPKTIFPTSTPATYPEPSSPGVAMPTVPGLAYEPQPGDVKLTRGEVFVDLENSRLQTISSQPVQVTAVLTGNLPDPCHQLRVVVTQPDKSNTINLEVYSLTDPSVNCITVIKPFEATISLGSFSSGHYTVYANGELLGEFDG